VVQFLPGAWLESGQEYDLAESFWREPWRGLVAAKGTAELWRVPWFKGEYLDGTPIRDANPIFSAVSPVLGKGVRIIQFEPTTNRCEIGYWMDAREGETEDETIRELVISCALSEQAVQRAANLLREWIGSGNAARRELESDLFPPSP
jgi:hypothetical protein